MSRWSDIDFSDLGGHLHGGVIWYAARHKVLSERVQKLSQRVKTTLVAGSGLRPADHLVGSEHLSQPGCCERLRSGHRALRVDEFSPCSGVVLQQCGVKFIRSYATVWNGPLAFSVYDRQAIQKQLGSVPERSLALRG